MTRHTWIWVGLSLTSLFTCGNAWDFITTAELDVKLRDNALAVVAFVAPSDDRSRLLETQWRDASVQATDSLAQFLSVDCSSPTNDCSSHELSKLPNIKLFKNGSPISTYQGPQRAAAISAWVKRVQRPEVTFVGVEDLNDFKQSDETVFIAYASTSESDFQGAFREAAASYAGEFSFGISTDPASLTAEDLDTQSIKCYRNIDAQVKAYKGTLDSQSITAFINDASRPTIAELLPHNHQRFLDRGWPMVYIFASTEAERAEIRSTLQKLARSQYESLTMVTVDPHEFPDLPVKLGLDPGAFPSGAVHQLSNDRIYPYPKGQPINPQALQQWGLDVWQGRVRPWSPPGSTPAPSQDNPMQIKASRKVSIRSFPGMKINIGRDEL